MRRVSIFLPLLVIVISLFFPGFTSERIHERPPLVRAQATGLLLAAQLPSRETTVAGLAESGMTVAAKPSVVELSEPGVPFGVQFLGGERDPAILTLARDAGIRWAHVYVSWAAIEPTNTTPEHYNWQRYDTAFANLAAYGFTPLVAIDSNPSWAASSPRGPIDRTGLDEFTEFVGALVARYKDAPYNVKYWSFYAEPDDWEVHPWDGTRGAWGGKGAEYARMLQAVWPVVHEVDPEAKVVLGALAYDWWSSLPNAFDRNFLDDIVANGGAAYFDVLNFNYYHRLRSKWNPPNIIGKALALRAKLPPSMQDKPILSSEIGEAYEPANPSDHEMVSRLVAQMYAHNFSAVDYGLNFLGSMWFSMESYEFEPGRVFGLLDPGGNPLPEYYAYQVMTQELAGAQYDRPLNLPGVEGYVFQLGGTRSSASVNLTGVSTEEKTVLWATGSSAQVTFIGTQARVVEKDGTVQQIEDGGPGDRDGTANGQIRIEVGPSPIFVGPPGCRVGIQHIMAHANRWHTSNALYDRNGDGRVNIQDIMIVVSMWGQPCSDQIPSS